MHKLKIAGRPIVDNVNSVTYCTSQYLHKHLVSTVQYLTTTVRSTRHALQRMIMCRPPAGSVVLCADVTSLYPSIPIQYGLNATRRILTNLRTTHHTDPNLQAIDLPLILALLEFVLTNNYITFMDTTYLQLCGTAMGTPIAVMYANIVLFDLEQDVIALNPYSYNRFLDDIFAIPISEQQALDMVNIFNSKCPSIQLEAVTIGNSGIFLDLTAEIVMTGTGEQILRTGVYQKPTNKHLYIKPTSNHEHRIFKNFVTAEFKRFKLHCSDYDEYLSTARKFSGHLINRGYSTKWIAYCYKQVPSRTQLLSQLFSPPSSSKTTGPVMIVNRTAIRAIPLARQKLQLPEALLHTHSYERKFKGKPTMYALSNPPSIGKYLLTSVHPRKPRAASTKPPDTPHDHN